MASGTECVARDQMVIDFAEQHYDVMIDANDLLVTFLSSKHYQCREVCLYVWVLGV